MIWYSRRYPLTGKGKDTAGVSTIAVEELDVAL